MEEIFKLDGQFPAWNIEGSSDDIPPKGFSWISWMEHITGKRRGRCSYMDCNEYATCGGHIWVKQIGCCIAPICSGCNYHSNSNRQQGSNSTLRQGIVIIKRNMTPGMLTSARHILQNNKCVDCNKNFIPKKMYHKKCDSCSGVYFHRKSIIGSWD